MPRFFISSFHQEEPIVITGDDAHHISHSLRMAVGETIELCNIETKQSFKAVINRITATDVECQLMDELANNGEPPYDVTLFQALPKSDKMDAIIQKSVECGVSSIVGFESSRCIIRLKDLDVDKKTGRWNRIAIEAAKQCGRSCLPQLTRILNYKTMLSELSEFDLVLFCYEGSQAQSIRNVLKDYDQIPQKIAIVIGSEGGFSAEEAAEAEKMGAKIVNLGRRILRTETASSVVLSMLTYEFELR